MSRQSLFDHIRDLLREDVYDFFTFHGPAVAEAEQYAAGLVDLSLAVDDLVKDVDRRLRAVRERAGMCALSPVVEQ